MDYTALQDQIQPTRITEKFDYNLLLEHLNEIYYLGANDWKLSLSVPFPHIFSADKGVALLYDSFQQLAAKKSIQPIQEKKLTLFQQIKLLINDFLNA